jgi:uncharacterized membrane protein YgcG
LQPRLDELTPRERRSDAALWTVFGALLLGSQLLLVPDIIREEQADWVTLVFCSALPVFLLSGFAASRFARAITGHVRLALAIGLPLLALGGEVVWPAEASAPGTLGLALVWAAGLCMVVALARTRAGAGIAFQKRLVAVRGYFAHELGQREPRLADAWTPYIIALGLGADMDDWFRAHGRSPKNSAMTLDPSSYTTSGGSSVWTGGGGHSGGGGASGSWVALGTLGASVSAAAVSSSGSGSDSSSGSASSGGGMSSGGGGGGGW